MPQHWRARVPQLLACPPSPLPCPVLHTAASPTRALRGAQQAWGSSEIHLVEGTLEGSTPSDGAAFTAGSSACSYCATPDHEPAQRPGPKWRLINRHPVFENECTKQDPR